MQLNRTDWLEQGLRLHISLGKSSIVGPDNASALAGLSTLERIELMGRKVVLPSLFMRR